MTNTKDGVRFERGPATSVAVRPTIDLPNPRNATATAYLRGRGISDKVIERHTIQGEYRFAGRTAPAVGFPYRGDEGVAAIKWRSADDTKAFSQQNVCEDFWGLDQYREGNDLLIVEGEIDALSWLSCDLPENLTVLSIPNGAPAKVKDTKISPEDDRKFSYLWRAEDQLNTAGRIILGFDSDKPGRALQAEILRRIGTTRDIWILGLGEFKDTNEALAAKGPAYCLGLLDAAKPLPTVGLYGVEEFRDEFTTLYDDGHVTGMAPGIGSLDKLMTIVPGMVTVVTGFPSSGKSDLIDQICLNLAREHGWKTVYSSFEKPPSLHLSQLCAKLVGKPFFEGPTPRMSREERDWAVEFCEQHFLFMDHSKAAPSTIDGILEVASKAVLRQGSRVLVIDPYNFITKSIHEKETDFVSSSLTQVQSWARRSDAHVFFIAHPTKISPDRREAGKKTIVTGHDIAGSAAWFAKADIGLTVWRHPEDEQPPEAIIWKCRWSHLGRHGSTQLDFDRVTGRWSDYTPEKGDPMYWELP
jgi:twinkle protein